MSNRSDTSHQLAWACFPLLHTTAQGLSQRQALLEFSRDRKMMSVLVSAGVKGAQLWVKVRSRGVCGGGWRYMGNAVRWSE